MKTKIKSLFAAMLIYIAASAGLSATGYPVFDISGWLTALDQLYSQYDMVANTITQIENQYRQIEQAVERAKSIDWDNISFDGDFDIRNDIRDANRRVNSLLNQARSIENTITSQSILCGTQRYSLADLCGCGVEDKNFFTACTDVKQYMTDSMENAVRALEGELTEEQKIYIWRKYGISPKNYLFVQQSVANVKQQASKVMAKVTDDAVRLQREDRLSRTNTIINAAYSQVDSDGNMTQGAANEAGLLLSSQMVEGLMGIDESVNDLAGLVADRMIEDENEKQAEKDEMLEQERKTEVLESRVPDYFRQ